MDDMLEPRRFGFSDLRARIEQQLHTVCTTRMINDLRTTLTTRYSPTDHKILLYNHMQPYGLLAALEAITGHSKTDKSVLNARYAEDYGGASEGE